MSAIRWDAGERGGVQRGWTGWCGGVQCGVEYNMFWSIYKVMFILDLIVIY